MLRNRVGMTHPANAVESVMKSISITLICCWLCFTNGCKNTRSDISYNLIYNDTNDIMNNEWKSILIRGEDAVGLVDNWILNHKSLLEKGNFKAIPYCCLYVKENEKTAIYNIWDRVPLHGTGNETSDLEWDVNIDETRIEELKGIFLDQGGIGYWDSYKAYQGYWERGLLTVTKRDDGKLIYWWTRPLHPELPENGCVLYIKNESAANPWKRYELNSFADSEAVRGWIDKNKKGLDYRSDDLSMIPEKILFYKKDNIVYDYAILEYVPDDSGPLADRKYKENIPESEIKALEALFKENGICRETDKGPYP